MPLFSIIVPIYNVEEFLPQCIESVVNQSYGDFELILVNDSSPDNSPEICESYAQTDSRITVVHKPNGGLSDARNAGMKAASGEYFCFLDGDDFMAENALKHIAQTILSNPEIDMVNCAHMNSYGDNDEELITIPIHGKNKNLNQKEFLSQLTNKPNFAYWAAWKNIYRKEIILKEQIVFKEGLIGAEDCEFFMNFVRKSGSFIFLNKPIVHYRLMREGSITQEMSYSAIMGQFIVFKENYDFYKKINTDQARELCSFFANKYANTLTYIPKLKNEEEQKQVINYVRNNKDILKNSKGKKYFIAKLTWSLLGYRKGSVMLNRMSSVKA